VAGRVAENSAARHVRDVGRRKLVWTLLGGGMLARIGDETGGPVATCTSPASSEAEPAAGVGQAAEVADAGSARPRGQPGLQIAVASEVRIVAAIELTPHSEKEKRNRRAIF